MRLLYALFGSIVFAGCTITSEPQSNAKPGKVLSGTDIELVRHFLDAFYQPVRTSYRVIPDAASEEGMRHLPVAERNRDLRFRLIQLRRAPSRVLRVNVHSGDRPEPLGSGHLVYSYDTVTGKFTAIGVHEIGEDDLDMWIDVRHWPDGTRVVSLRLAWVDDSKDNIFYLRNGEEIFRFAVAIDPLID